MIAVTRLKLQLLQPDQVFFLKRFCNWCRGKPPAFSGFLFKKKPPCTILVTPRKLENRSKRHCWRELGGAQGAQLT
jgi:hypothetical protein